MGRAGEQAEGTLCFIDGYGKRKVPRRYSDADENASSFTRLGMAFPLKVSITLSACRAHVGLGLSLAQSLLAQCRGFVRGFPRKIRIFAAKVPIRRGLLIDWTAQLERLDNPFRGEMEILADELFQL